MKRRLFQLILLCFFILEGNTCWGQDINLYYDIKSGINDRDTVMIYALSTSTSSVSISAVNFSLAFQSSCSASYSLGSCSALDTLVEVNYSWFSNNWGSFFERCEIKSNVNLLYNSISYDHRFSYGSSSLLTPWIVPASTAPDRMLIFKLTLDKTCLGDVYLESQSENSINQISNSTFTPLPYQIFRFGSAFPVDFAFFNAETTKDDQVKLSWVTQNEVNSDYFEVQKSYTGRFDAPVNLGKVTAKGNSEEKTPYEFWDSQPRARQVFYRLVHFDVDGSRQYSPTISLRSEDVTFSVSVVSDPFEKGLTLKLFSSENRAYKIHLLDLHGRIVLQDQSRFGPDEGNQMQWQMSHLPSGMYMLKIMDDAENEKIIKTYLR